VVEHQEQAASWVHQRVAVDAAYGRERLIIHIFLPREADPPYQPVIYWPHGGASLLDVVSPGRERLTFLIRSGRAVVVPSYKGTYERKVKAGPGNDWWEQTVQQVKDFSRSIDYLETRKQDFDLGAIGYYESSATRVLALAIDQRIKAAVLADGGLPPGSTLRSERHVVNYLPRITIPVLMLNGRFDALLPPKESQEPMFKLLGADPSRKAYRLSDSSHVAEPSIERIQDTVGWFDRYLGPVKLKARPAIATE
jgi:pimeloyl-ACP methyl ester carboxylesterase